jgi:hypothetical protein
VTETPVIQLLSDTDGPLWSLLVLLGALALIGAGTVVLLYVRAVRQALALVRQRRAKGVSDRHRALRALANDRKKANR